MTETRSGLSVLRFANPGEFKTWLAKQPHDATGLWIKFARKTATSATLTKAEAIDVALCHGWIDGKIDKYDDMHWLVRFTPRKPRSKWSAINRKRALELAKEGRMRPAGLAQIEAAKADGRWDSAYAAASSAEVPDDLRKALNKSAKAAAFFATLNSRTASRSCTASAPSKRRRRGCERLRNSWRCLSAAKQYTGDVRSGAVSHRNRVTLVTPTIRYPALTIASPQRAMGSE